MAHQTLAQISTELRSLILGNAGIQVYFRLNRQDAQLLAKEGFGYSGFEVKRMSFLRPIFQSLAEEWERKIEELQNLSPRYCYVKHKIEGGIIPLRTVDIQPAWKVLGMSEEKYSEFLKDVRFGMKYLLPRRKLDILSKERQRLVTEKVEARREKEKKPTPIPPKTFLGKEKVKRKETILAEKEKAQILEGVGGQQHRYLQTLIKKTAEEKGYRAIIEKPTPDGLGKVDVGLERNGKKIACEISLTSTGEQELSNIEKCLKADYDEVILCSPEKKTLGKVEKLTAQKLKESEQQKALFFQPEELFFQLEEQAAGEASKEERVKGYKVKVEFQPVAEAEKRTKREAVAQVIFQALRRLKKGKK